MPRLRKFNEFAVCLSAMGKFIGNFNTFESKFSCAKGIRIYWDLSMDARKLVEDCEKKIGWKLAPILYSFTDDFETFRNDVLFSETIDENEIKKFIKICDNRIEHAKTFLSDIATVLGFLITSMAFIVALSSIKIEPSDTLADPVLNIVKNYGIIFTFFVALLLSGIFILLIFLVRYRTRVHAWTAFKEIAILKRNCNQP